MVSVAIASRQRKWDAAMMVLYAGGTVVTWLLGDHDGDPRAACNVRLLWPPVQARVQTKQRAFVDGLQMPQRATKKSARGPIFDDSNVVDPQLPSPSSITPSARDAEVMPAFWIWARSVQPYHKLYNLSRAQGGDRVL